jgi:DNA-binding MarR family transcriptional regulator
VADRLHSAAIHLLRRVRRVDSLTGLTPSRASVLSVLVFGGPRTLGELAKAEQVSAPTMTRLVSGLEADGLVRRAASTRDRRVVVAHATPEGQRRLRQGRERRVAELAELMAGLGPEALETLGRAASLVEVLAVREPAAPRRRSSSS